MRYCGPRGIPLSVFLGWSRDDQDAALEWSARESRRCTSCGQLPDEGPVHAHVDTCQGCAVQKAAQPEAADLPGGHVHLARGLPTECPRCARELEANRPRG